MGHGLGVGGASIVYNINVTEIMDQFDLKGGICSRSLSIFCWVKLLKHKTPRESRSRFLKIREAMCQRF